MGTLGNDDIVLFASQASITQDDVTSSNTANLQQLYNSAIYKGSPFATSADAFKASTSGGSSNTFGVNDVRQMVKDLEGGIVGDAELKSLPSDILTNIQSKIKGLISDDSELSEAFKKAGEEVSEISQNMLNSDVLNSKELFDTDFKYDPSSLFESPLSSGIGNYTSDLSLRSIIPDSMTVSDYGKMQDIFNKGSMSSLSDCPNINDAFGYVKKLLDPSQLFGSLSGLFGLIGDYDMSGVIDCLSSTQSQLDMVQRKGLGETLISKGAISGFSDFQSIGGSSSISNKYDTVRRIASNRTVTTDPYTKRTNNTWSNPDVINTSDSILSDFGIDKASLFSADTIDSSKNSSILDSIGNVFDVTEIAKYNPASGFVNYCIGDTSELLSPLSSMFS